MSDNFIYDDVPYPSFTFSQTHPDRLATIAKLYGLNPADVENCRVLELGCGDGSNLNWIADTLPKSKFTGVDLSAKHIADATKNAEDIGLKNVEFHAADVMTLSVKSFGKFDYIIAHGLFSWVPDFVREKILQIYREMVMPNGVGYISYNAYPGCHLRDMTRNMIRFHAKDLAEPMQQVEESLKFLSFLGETAENDSIHQKVLKSELSKMADRRHENIFHDDLAEFNQPFYFSEFVAEAEKNGLQYLSEVEYFSTQTQHLPLEVQEIFESLNNDIVRKEQYLDFISSRRFRQTLICQKEIEVKREINPQIIQDFLIASPVTCESEIPDFAGNTAETFLGTKKASFQMNHPLTKAALFQLGKIWTKAISFDELITRSIELLDDKSETANSENVEIATRILFKLFAADFVKLHVFQPFALSEISEKPKVSGFARWQAKRGNPISTFSGRSISLDDEMMRKLVISLDGTRTTSQILEMLQSDSQADMHESSKNLLEQNLLKMAKHGLLIG